MANFIELTVTKESGDSPASSFNQLFDPSRMEQIRLNAAATGILFFYPDENGKLTSFESTSVTSLTTLKGQVNLGAPIGRNAVVLVFDPSAVTGDRTIAAHDLLDTNGNVFYLPANSVITNGFYNVKTTFTSATDAATISLGIPTDDVAGIKAAIAISNGANPWDAILAAAIIQTGAAANHAEKTTATRTVQATVAVEALTAGKLYLYLEYVTLPS